MSTSHTIPAKKPLDKTKFTPQQRKQLKTIREKLLSLKDLKVEHACLVGADAICDSRIAEHHYQNPITFLTKDRRAFARHIGATTTQSQTTLFTMSADSKVGAGAEPELSSRKILPRAHADEIESVSAAADFDITLTLRIVEAGKNFLPSRLESDVLGRRCILRNAIYIPEDESQFWATIYMLLVHENFFADHEVARNLIKKRLSARFGVIVKCKYQDVHHYTEFQ